MKGLRERRGVWSYRLRTPLGRKEIRIGEVEQSVATTVALNIKRIADFEELNQPLDPRLIEWWRGSGKEIRDRVRRAGLMSVHIDMATWEDALERWLAKRVTLEDNSKRMVAVSTLAWDPHKRLLDMDESDALRFRQILIDRGLAEATVNRTCQAASGVFAAAIKSARLPMDNPFETVDITSVVNRARQVFVHREWIDAMLAKCSREWRLRLLIIRYLGLRAPSELEALRVGHINWQDRLITIPKCKTAERQVPIFPELHDPLRRWCLDFGLRDRSRVVPVADLNCMRTIQKKAGVQPWPKPMVNMRSTRQTELAEHFPEHVVAYWLGNSENVGRRHYLQVTAEHIAKATGLA